MELYELEPEDLTEDELKALEYEGMIDD